MYRKEVAHARDLAKKGGFSWVYYFSPAYIV
jgi:hypothetical protein